MSSNDGVLIIDDTIAKKPYMAENDMAGWFYDHTENRSVKGITVLSLLYQNTHVSVPIAAHVVERTGQTDPKGKIRLKSETTKNEQFRTMLAHAVDNIPFRWVLGDSWFGSLENMKAVLKTGAHFIFALKSNRHVALMSEHAAQGLYQEIGLLNWLEPSMFLKVWLPRLAQAVFIVKEVFKDGDDKQAERYLVTSDPTLDTSTASAIYQRRWKVEECHRSIKQAFSLEKCPASSKKAQKNLSLLL